MIGYLNGIVISVEGDSLILDVGGVGYSLNCPRKMLASIIEGQSLKMHVNTIVKEDSITLYGFESKLDKDWFNNVQTVQGVGPRMALAIIGMMNPEEIIEAIISEDASCFKRVSGVGPKLAARIVNELKDKKNLLPHAYEKPQGKAAEVAGNKDFSADAISALVNLGFARKDAFFTVRNIIGENDNIDLEETIRLALTKLSS